LWGWQVDGTDSGSCPTTAYGIDGVNLFGSARGVKYYDVIIIISSIQPLG